ncbi:predicted protein, partial [Nematostella vectensis]
NIMLLAYKRSGSSFVGQLLNQHPDVMYLYEPLYFVKSLSERHPSAFRLLSHTLLSIIYTCNFQRHPYFVSQLSDSPFRLYTRPLSDPPMCPARISPGKIQDHCQRLYARTLSDICQSFRYIVVKSIRVESLESLVEFKEFSIESPWTVFKVVHLVRDPRAIISSRLRTETSTWTADKVKKHARALCTRMLRNLQKGTAKHWTGSYHVIRYEDVAEDPEKAAKELYEYLRLSKTTRIRDWVTANARGKHNENAFSTTKNATIAINTWRLTNDLETIRVIEAECSRVMMLLGYRRAGTGAEMRDLS